MNSAKLVSRRLFAPNVTSTNVAPYSSSFLGCQVSFISISAISSLSNMRARGATSVGVQGVASLLEERSKWVNVTWMPHASLSQTSHVSLAVRSILTSLDELKHYEPEEWRVRATIHGMGGQSIVPISCLTPTAPVRTLYDQAEAGANPPLDFEEKGWIPLISNATHVCRLDSLIILPMRWRDLPRDAHLRFEVLGHCDEVVSVTEENLTLDLDFTKSLTK